MALPRQTTSSRTQAQTFLRRTLPHVSPPTLVVACAITFALLYVAAEILTSGLGHDQTWYIFAAERILDGARPYGPLLAETNPPLILWFSTLPVMLARLLHIEFASGLHAIVLPMMIGTALWCASLLRRSPLILDPLFPRLIACAILLLELRVGGYDFGQREHLFFILVLPYLFAAGSGAAVRISLAERCAVGFVAGLAVSFKPQEALVILAAEIVLVVLTRSLKRAFSADLLVLLCTGALYVALVRIITPLYNSETLPLLFSTYWAYGTSSALSLARHLKLIYLSIVGIFLACLILRSRLAGFSVIISLLACSLGASVAYDLQHADWPYHLLPCSLLLSLAEYWLLIELLLLLFRRYGSLLRLSLPVALAMVALGFVAFAMRLNRLDLGRLRPYAYRHSQFALEPLDQIFTGYQPSSKVYVFSTALLPLPKVGAHHLTWASRFPCLWLLPAIIRNEQPPSPLPPNFKRLSPETLAQLAALQRSETTEDLNRWQPRLILIENCTIQYPCQALEGINFDILAWFLQSPDFAAAWSHYQRQPGPAPYDVYTRIN